MKRTAYTLGSDIPVDEELRETRGGVIEYYVEAAVEEALGKVRGRGRPSLSTTGESPLLRVRVSRDLDAAVRQAAKRAGTSRSQWVRLALERASRETD